ncbi:MAG: prolyl oligopeptidase family serine peptidase, partial [Pirellulaceae bacterium]|nr:prolyl oligopeptidase family serine peptidase [Pirellulaceae bacterium]
KWVLQGYSRLLAQHGFVVVTINYRLAPQFQFPAQVDDVRQALIWTVDNADRFSIDTERLGIFGYSAGGHLSTLVSVLADEPVSTQMSASVWQADDPRWKRLPKVSAVCAGGPPCDFRDLPLDNSALAFFLGGSRREKPDVYAAASPISHVSAADPVTHFIHGDQDLMVPIDGSRAMANALKKAGVDVRYKTMPGQGHLVTFADQRTRQSMVRFFEGVLLQPARSNWDMRKLGTMPAFRWVDQESPIRELIYQGQPINGQPTDVFAFYATPGSIAGDPSLDKDLPVVVLVHGGGGTAFADWVWLWAKRGYAAIAMDLSGHRPESPTFTAGELVSNLRAKRERLPNGGPDQGSAEKFSSVGGSVDDDWPYHAVGNVIRAHSLVRGFPEIDAQRTAITGISWGGYTTCIVASVDDRFKAAVPVYGCGFLYDGESVQRKQIDALPQQQRRQWIAQYDPSRHLPYCHVPIFFVNGTNDKHYPLKSYSRSYAAVAGEKWIRIEPNMRHSHQAGWEPKEIGMFIDSKLRDAQPIPRLDAIARIDGGLQVSYRSEQPLESSTLHYTTDTGPLVTRKWQSTPAVVGKQQIRVQTIPSDAKIAFFTVTDPRGAMVSTDAAFLE